MKPNDQTVIAIDYGEKRVGIARASLSARIPSPLTTLVNDDQLLNKLKEIAKEHNVCELVVGYPRGLDGQATKQTKIVEDFIDKLKITFDIPISPQDEALTSQKAEAELEARGNGFQKADVDALAATYILEDWLQGLKKDEII